MQTSSWALAKANLEHDEGRNFTLHYPFTRVQKCGSHARGWGQQCLLLCWGLRRHQGCQEHHPSTSDICSVFSHHNLPKDNSKSCLYCALRLLTWRKYRSIYVIILISKYLRETHDLLCPLLLRSCTSGSVTQASVPWGQRCSDGRRETVRHIQTVSRSWSFFQFGIPLRVINHKN